MKSKFTAWLLAITSIAAFSPSSLGQEKNLPIPSAAGATFTGEKTSWHGFDRYDFLMDETKLTLKPIKATPDEKNGIKGQVKGQLRCVVVVPKEAAAGNPWSWRGYYFDHEPQAEIELLKRGFHIGFILSDAGKQWDAWYTFLTEKHGLSKKPAFVGMSRGGRNAFTWATANPDKVSCIYADNPAISRESLMKLGELAAHDVPLLHVCGSLDPILGNHTLVVENIYQQLGGRISVMIKEGGGHHPHSLRDPKPIADFIVQSLQPAGGNTPSFVGKKFTKSSYYGVENSYRDFPTEGTYITCRGPWFTESYDRYEFKLDGIKGSVAVIVPKSAATGMPWVFRADFVGRDAVVDLSLLSKGFHIVTGPVPTDTNGPVLQQWNAVYKHLTDQSFSKKPVLEGAGGAAGEAYAWAIANPDKVTCIYGENPVLRSNMSKTPPLDNLAALAKAGVPILHVCGSLDPWFKSQTLVAEKRYKELGGQITVIIQEGEGHYPLAPKDRQPVVDFILKSVR
jgi:pimeloyl-ACP methyl ester carboxylesterase